VRNNTLLFEELGAKPIAVCLEFWNVTVVEVVREEAITSETKLADP
jgi:hypothetical protein